MYSDLIDRQIDFDQCEFYVVWAMHLSFFPLLSAVPPFLQTLPFGGVGTYNI